jgi:hypothetical protein
MKYTEEEFKKNKTLQRINKQIIIGSWLGTIFVLLLMIFLIGLLLKGIFWAWGAFF